LVKNQIDSAWYVKESLKIMFPHWLPEDKRVVMVAQLYQAYLDESGTHRGSQAIVVAGFISNQSEWTSFSEEWKTALDEWQIPKFHMVDFAHNQGIFKSWSEQTRRERLNHLLGIIKRHTFSSIAFVIFKKSFDEIISEQARILCKTAYELASIGCYHNLSVHAKKRYIDGHIAYVMESGSLGREGLARMHGLQSRYPEWVEDTRIKSLSFQDKQSFTPLQAADILAYEIYKDTERQFLGGERPPRYPLKRLAVLSHQWHRADDNELRKVNDYLADLAGKLVSMD